MSSGRTRTGGVLERMVLPALDEGGYLNSLCGWIGEYFGGYSICHVDGRFLAGKMLWRDEAAERERSGQRYLVDETTAVTRKAPPMRTSNRWPQLRLF
jgi:hypothetical protein